jgi:hypothetical protein
VGHGLFLLDDERMSTDGIPNGTPIRMVTRISFADGTEYECEVRSPHAVDAPMASFWPEGVVTPDVAKRMEYEQERQKEMRELRSELAEAMQLAAILLRKLGGTATITDEDLTAEPGILVRMGETHGYSLALKPPASPRS